MATTAPATATTPTTPPTNPPNATTPKENSAAPTAPDAQKRVDAIIAVAVKACNAPDKGQSPPGNIAKYLPIVMKEMAQAGLVSKNHLAGIIATVYAELGDWVPRSEEPGSAAISQPDGGMQYVGRGFIQITHNYNYEAIGKWMGLDLLSNPEKLNDPVLGAKSTVGFWIGICGIPVAPKAEAGDYLGVRRVVNGGTNGLSYFKYAWDICMAELPEGASPDIVGVAPGASYGVSSCADGGNGSNKTIVAPGASTQSDALAYALGIHNLEVQKSHTVKLLLNANAQPEILTLRAQTKFKLEGLGEPKITTESTGTIDVKSVSLGKVEKSDSKKEQAKVDQSTDPVVKGQSGVSPDTANAPSQGNTPTPVTPIAPIEKPTQGDTGYEGEYTIEEVVKYLEPDGWTVEIIGYKPDPNAPDPTVFKHDPNSSTDKASVTAAGALPSNPSEINGKLLAAAKSNIGASSSSGPGGGNVACAWCMQKYVFNPGIGHAIGGDAVESIVTEFEKNGYGVKVPNDQILAGDVVIMGDGDHVGIALTDKGTEVLSNSSSRASFKWIDSLAGYDRFYSGGKCKAYRVLK